MLNRIRGGESAFLLVREIIQFGLKLLSFNMFNLVVKAIVGDGTLQLSCKLGVFVPGGCLSLKSPNRLKDCLEIAILFWFVDGHS